MDCNNHLCISLDVVLFVHDAFFSVRQLQESSYGFLATTKIKPETRFGSMKLFIVNLFT